MLAGNYAFGAAQTSGRHIVCTLFEGDYHFGVAALINSMVAAGFAGSIVVGYRGAPPPWVEGLERIGPSDVFAVGEATRLKFTVIDSETHFSDLKAAFMLSLIRDNPGFELISYFDPDITIRCAWRFFDDWVSRGVALCEDVTNATMPANHPIRLAWVDVATAAGFAAPRTLSRYYNAGFVGLPAANAGFLQIWQTFIDIAGSRGADLGRLRSGRRTDRFHGQDQDALNLAVMYARDPLTTIGPEGMGFVPGGFTLYHAVGVPKPWRRKMIWSALQGAPPTGADRAFLDHAGGRIRPYGLTTLRAKRLAYKAAALIGRFYRRRL
jgi:hypothetical protein